MIIIYIIINNSCNAATTVTTVLTTTAATSAVTTTTTAATATPAATAVTPTLITTTYPSKLSTPQTPATDNTFSDDVHSQVQEKDVYDNTSHNATTTISTFPRTNLSNTVLPPLRERTTRLGELFFTYAQPLPTKQELLAPPDTEEAQLALLRAAHDAMAHLIAPSMFLWLNNN